MLNHYKIEFFHDCMEESMKKKKIYQFPSQIHEAVKHIHCFSTTQSTRIAVITNLLGRGTTKREGK